MKANEETSISSILPLAVFFVFFAILLIIGEKRGTKIVQIIALLLISYFVILNNPIVYQVGYILLIFVYFLSRKYQLFVRGRNIYHAILLLFLFFSIYMSLQNYGIDSLTVDAELTVWHIANQMMFIIATITLIYIVFEDDIRRLTEENRNLNTHIEKSRVFVNLGENISGLVHNMNGDLGLISMSLSMLEEDVDHKAIEFLKKGNRNLQAKIRNILTLAKYSQASEDTDISLNALLYSLLEVFAINRQYKIVETETEFADEVFFYGNPSEISQVFENILKNAYEALIENVTGNSEPHLSVRIKGESASSIVEFEDNGPGIKACLDKGCGGECMNCNAFKIGRTTKKEGTGLGMISVMRTLEKYRGQLKIRTSREGTTVSVILSRG